MRTIPYWIDTGPIKKFPVLNRDLNVDVLVIGAGVTGITTSYLLKKAGLTVALIERERVASIDTGHTTAHLTYVTDSSLRVLKKDFGFDHAQAAWDANAAAIDEIESIVSQEEIDCEFTRAPGYLHIPLDGSSGDDASDLEEEAQLAQKMGFDATYLDAIPHFRIPGIRFANQAKFHPRKYLAKLVETIPGNGSHVFEETTADGFDAEKRRVKANGHWISFDRVAIATNNPLVGFSSIAAATLFQTKISLYSSYALGGRVPRGALPVALFWDTKDPYDYLRIDRHQDYDYVIFGGEDQKTGQGREPDECFNKVMVRFQKIAPDVEIDHRWSGQVIVTSDDLPYIGENAERQFIATGFCGNGITFGTISAMMARDWAVGAKNPWSELFSPDRKIIRGGVWDYLRENKDYPYYLIKDKLTRAEADSVRDLERNAGMIVKSKHGKIAAYRDSKGEVHKRSAVCTAHGLHCPLECSGTNVGLSMSRLAFPSERRSDGRAGGNAVAASVIVDLAFASYGQSDK